MKKDIIFAIILFLLVGTAAAFLTNTIFLQEGWPNDLIFPFKYFSKWESLIIFDVFALGAVFYVMYTFEKSYKMNMRLG